MFIWAKTSIFDRSSYGIFKTKFLRSLIMASHLKPNLLDVKFGMDTAESSAE